jgi:hypothetical protein
MEDTMLKPTTISVSSRGLFMSGKNSSLPKPRSVMAARMAFEQDIDEAAPHYTKNLSFRPVPILGRVPSVQS